MRAAVNQIIPWTLLLLPFLILAYFYSSLPAEILIARHLDGSGGVYGPKSLVSVFRVPLIELVCALAIEIMRGRFPADPAHRNYYLMWSILLYTVALKSLLQALEIISTDIQAPVFLYSTAAVVVIGIVLAFIAGPKAFTGLNRREWRLALPEILVLLGLLLAYAALALVPIYVFG